MSFRETKLLQSGKFLLGLAVLFPITNGSASEEPPYGLVEIVSPSDNPLTEQKVALGKRLFFDKTLSRDGSVSCATCHVPSEAFAQRGHAVSKGVDGRVGRRNAPSLLNVAFAKSLFHDGRSASLEDQAWQPILAEEEMGSESEQEVLERLGASEEYVASFKEVFGVEQPDKVSVARALASYQRTLLSGNSAFDKWNWGESDALSEAAHEGYKLFAGQAMCWQCHPLNSPGAVLLTDHTFHDTGLSYISEQKRKREGKPGDATEDLGRFEVTGQAKDRWQYRTPSLRNVALTAPYMHDGSIATLVDVVEFYNRAEGKGELQPLNLDEEQVHALVAFLEALTGDQTVEQ